MELMDAGSFRRWCSVAPRFCVPRKTGGVRKVVSMYDAASVPPAKTAMVRRLRRRLQGVLEEDPSTLETRLSCLDGWTLSTLLRATGQQAGDGAASPRPRHLGVVGVDHALGQLVVGEPRAAIAPSRAVETVDFDGLDDEDLIAASRYVPETLPGYVLG